MTSPRNLLKTRPERLELIRTSRYFRGSVASAVTTLIHQIETSNSLAELQMSDSLPTVNSPDVYALVFAELLTTILTPHELSTAREHLKMFHRFVSISRYIPSLQQLLINPVPDCWNDCNLGRLVLWIMHVFDTESTMLTTLLYSFYIFVWIQFVLFCM